MGAQASPRLNSRVQLFVSIGVVVAAVMIRYATVIGQWWLWDDLQLLYGADISSPAELLFSPSMWRIQSTANFVPLLSLSLKADLATFGFVPRGFYLHHLAAAAAASVVVLLVARAVMTHTLALATAVTFVFAPATGTVYSLLMNRHYIEGLILAAAAWLFLLRDGRGPLVGAALYLGAMLAKEVYAPLPLLVIAIGLARSTGWKWIASRLLFCTPAAAIYIVWRVIMLQGIGGYGGERGAASQTALAKLFEVIAGRESSLMFAVLVATAWLMIRAVIRFGGPRSVSIAGLCAVFVALPLVPLAQMDDRYAFVATAILLLICGAVATSLGSVDAFITASAVLLIVLVAGRVRSAALSSELQQMTKEGLQVYTAPSNQSLGLLHSNGWYLDGVSWLRRRTGRGEPPPYALSAEGAAFLGSPRSDLEIRRAAASRRTMPMHVSLARRGNALLWRLGPASPHTTWMFVRMPRHELLPISATGWVRVPSQLRAPADDVDAASRAFRILRRDDDRSWSVTPLLPLPSDGCEVSWSGDAGVRTHC